MREPGRLTRVVCVVTGLMVASLAIAVTEPDVKSAARRLDEARARERSDAIVLGSRGFLEHERLRLLARHRSVVDGSAQFRFIHTLAATARRHDVRVLSVDVTTRAVPIPNGRRVAANLAELGLQLHLRGAYRNLLTMLDDLGRAADSVSIEMPSLRGDGSNVEASIPVVLRQANPSETTQ